jgi:hypothetical protein
VFLGIAEANPLNVISINFGMFYNEERLEQSVIVRFPWSEKKNAVKIHYRLFRAFQEDAYTFSSVYESIRAFKTDAQMC